MLEYRNIYQTARVSADLTQESAAELLAISTESLGAYEQGRRRPPDEVVCRMAQVYHSTYLCYQHLLSGALGDVLPDVQPKQLAQATLRLLRLIGKFARSGRLDQLAEINEDGVITEDEMPLANEIMAELRDIITTGLELDYATLGQIESAQAVGTATERIQNKSIITRSKEMTLV